MDNVHAWRRDLWLVLSSAWLGASSTATLWFLNYAGWHLYYFDRFTAYYLAVVCWVVLHIFVNAVFIRHLRWPAVSYSIGFVCSLRIGKLLTGLATMGLPQAWRMALADMAWAYWVLGGIVAIGLQFVLHKILLRDRGNTDA